MTLSLDVKVDITAEKRKQQVRLSWEPVEGAYAYCLKRYNKQKKLFDKHITLECEEYIDHDVDLAEKYTYSVYGLYAQHFPTKHRAVIDVTIEDGTGETGEITGLDAKETPNTVALIWDGTDKAAWYNVYQKSPYGIYKLIAKTTKTEYIHDKVVTNVPFIYAVEAVTPGGVSNREEVRIDMEAKPYKRKMETLGRGAVAMKTENGVFLSWRLNAWEYEAGIDFMLCKNGKKLALVTDSTNYLDKDGTADDIYTIKAVKDRKAEKNGAEVRVVDAPYIRVPLDKPAPAALRDGKTYEYTANDAAVADLDGDGEYEIILRWDYHGHDNSHKGFTGNVYIDAYKLDGKKLWRIDMGRNIRAGQHYTKMMVYDLDSDGKAEIVLKTADGTVDGAGNVIGDANADYVNDDGFIIDGPEFLTLFDGETGAAIDTVDYNPPGGNAGGDSWENRVDRFLACAAYLDGVNPSVVICRSDYDCGRPINLVAYDVIDKRLVKRWKFIADKDQEYTYQGNHNLSVGDVDGDGKDEIIYGALAVDDDGTEMYLTGLRHGDTPDLDNFMPDLDLLRIHGEDLAGYGSESRDPAGAFSNNWKKGHPCIQADILGDWREEVVWRNADDTELRIYTTTHLTEHKFYTLMHDSLYRCSVAFQNTAYNQCTKTSFYIGPDMKGMPPVPSNEYVNGEQMPDFTEDIT